MSLSLANFLVRVPAQRHLHWLWRQRRVLTLWGLSGGGGPSECAQSSPGPKAHVPGGWGSKQQRQERTFYVLSDGSTAKSALPCAVARAPPRVRVVPAVHAMWCTCGAHAVHRRCLHTGGAQAVYMRRCTCITHASFTSGSSVQHCVASCSSGWGSTRASRRRVARPRPGTRAASVGTRRGGRPHILRRLAVRSQSGLTGLDAPRGG